MCHNGRHDDGREVQEVGGEAQQAGGRAEVEGRVPGLSYHSHQGPHGLMSKRTSCMHPLPAEHVDQRAVGLPELQGADGEQQELAGKDGDREH